MTTNYNELPTFLGSSEEALGVIAGGGFMGFDGIVLHEPTSARFDRVSSSVEDDITPKGVVFDYGDVATVTISGLLRWTNRRLPGAPSGRQDVREAGPVRIEIFDTKEARGYIEKMSRLFGRLGIRFVD